MDQPAWLRSNDKGPRCGPFFSRRVGLHPGHPDHRHQIQEGRGRERAAEYRFKPLPGIVWEVSFLAFHHDTPGGLPCVE